MLAPVTAATTTAPAGTDIKPSIALQGKETTALVALPERPAVLPALPALDSQAVEQLKRLILSSGDGGRGVIAILADAVARSMNIERLPGEDDTAFFVRIADQARALAVDKLLAVEIRSGLKSLGVPLQDLARILRQPVSADAARLVARLEAAARPFTGEPADTVTHSYIDDGAGPRRPTETLVAMKAANASANGQNLFADGAPAPAATREDARFVQAKLVEAYVDNELIAEHPAMAGRKPADAEARQPLPARPDAEANAEPQSGQTPGQTPGQTLAASQGANPAAALARLAGMMAGARTPDLAGQATRATAALAGMIETLITGKTDEMAAPDAATGHPAPLDTRPETETVMPGRAPLTLPVPAERTSERPAPALVAGAPLPKPEPKTSEATPVRERQPTFLALRGLTEVVTQLAGRAADAIDARIEARVQNRILSEMLEDGIEMPQPTREAAPKPFNPLANLLTSIIEQPQAAAVKTTPEIASRDTAAPLRTVEAEPAETAGLITAGDKDATPETVLRQTSSDTAPTREQSEAAARQMPVETVPVPYAFVPYPIEDERDPPKARRRDEEDREDADDQDRREDEGEEKRERASAPEEDLLAAEPDEDLPPLGRGATDADRAFRHFQRMGGF